MNTHNAPQGVIRVRRAYFTCERCGAGFSPLDGELALLGGWSERGVEQVLWTAQAVGSYREAAEALERWAGVVASKSTIQRMVVEYGNALVQRQQEEAQALWESGVKGEEIPPPREGQKEADGVMVWVEDGRHEVRVGSCFTFGPGQDGKVETSEVGYLARYGDVEDFRQTMWWYAYHRGLGLEGKGVVIGDGAKWIDGSRRGEDCGLVPCDGACEAYGEEAGGWVKKVEERLWQGEVEEVAAECERVLAKREGWSESVLRTREYFRERKEQMNYPAFRAAGYPIGSGTVESACKGIGWRCKGRGQRWSKEGLMAILALRSAGMGTAEDWSWAWEQIRQAA